MSAGYFFSASTGGFYHPSVHAEMPADVVALTDAEHRALLAGQAEGRPIIVGPAGRPTLGPRPGAVPAVPAAVTRLQARLTCLELPAPPGSAAESLWDALESWQWPTPQARAYFEDSAHWRRTDPLLIQIAQQVGLNNDDLDDLFVLAATK